MMEYLKSFHSKYKYHHATRDFHQIAIKKSHHGTRREILKNRLGSFDGLEEYAPFDRILISGATKKIPEKLLPQLKEEGILVAPVGEHEQSLVKIQKTKNKKQKTIL